ncbi:MAG TPA: imidazole glycerol phosphate synthase subunit HisH [Candidatus Fournierella merdigallinarum]|nr:imidazole glycerol phosphate synthase subunit HisH [Candidatus Fournierella merdigallinarum]
MGAVITVVDYGRSNLLSVRRALEHCGAQVRFASAPEEVLRAQALVLPGVGAFADGMEQLRRQGLAGPIRQKAGEGTPLLGICLGMQMLLEAGVEGGLTEGLGLIAGQVGPLPDKTADGAPLKVPHVGWGALTLAPSGASGLLRGTRQGDEVYFVHSFAARPARREDCAATVEYGGHTVCAAVARGNVTGLQFHPEKSGPVGLCMIRAFVESIG